MDYKEMYEQAIKRAKAMIQVAANQEEIYNSVITIFPELKESADEVVRKAIINIVTFSPEAMFDRVLVSRDDALAWLEKQGEQKPAWSEEDDRMMNDTLAVVDWYAGKHRNISVKVSNWLKLLKSRVLSSSSLREFDKEEGNVIDHLIAICDDAMCYDTFAGCSKKDIEKYKNFLTNLKFGINPQPQTTWKPSDEQMAELRRVISGCSYDIEPLVEMKEQLKKLREE